MSTTDKWIGTATENKGGLHRALNIPEGQKIPQEKIQEAVHRGGKIAKEAHLALTLKKLHH